MSVGVSISASVSIGTSSKASPSSLHNLCSPRLPSAYTTTPASLETTCWIWNEPPPSSGTCSQAPSMESMRSSKAWRVPA